MIWLERIAGRLGATTNAAPLVPLDSADWNRDDVVVRHELGHAVAWYHHGEGIGRLRFNRAVDGLLEAGIVLGPARSDQEETDAFIDAYAERLLAGEAAARRWLGLPRGCVSLRGLAGHRLPMGIGPMDLAETLCEPTARDGLPAYDDITKVLLEAEKRHRCVWKQWISQRIRDAEVIVDANAAVIEAAAALLQPLLPHSSSPFELPGQHVMELLTRFGATTSRKGPVPLG